MKNSDDEKIRESPLPPPQALMMELRFSITDYAAYSPGLDSSQAWQEWARAPHLPCGNTPPELTEMPAMMRRRLGPLGRMAAQAAYRCQTNRSGMPVVFASRYGDAARSLGLLRSLAVDGIVSPTDFGLSVHNGIGAQYSIARGDQSNFISVAAGAASAAAGLIESVALLEDGADEVMLVCYDAPLPDAYARFHDEPAGYHAWALRLTRPGAMEGVQFGLTVGPANQTEPECGMSQLPFGLDIFRFFLSGDPLLRRRADGRTWTWRRHA
jgi:hypothetical protein